MSTTLAFLCIHFTETTATILDETFSYPIRNFRSLIDGKESIVSKNAEIGMEKKREDDYRALMEIMEINMFSVDNGMSINGFLLWI